MTETSHPGKSVRWLGGSPLDWAMLVIGAPAMALLYWHDMPALMLMVGAVMMGIAPAKALRRHHAGIEAVAHPGLQWTTLICSIGVILLGALVLVLP